MAAGRRAEATEVTTTTTTTTSTRTASSNEPPRNTEGVSAAAGAAITFPPHMDKGRGSGSVEDVKISFGDLGSGSDPLDGPPHDGGAKRCDRVAGGAMTGGGREDLSRIANTNISIGQASSDGATGGGGGGEVSSGGDGGLPRRQRGADADGYADVLEMLKHLPKLFLKDVMAHRYVVRDAC